MLPFSEHFLLYLLAVEQTPPSASTMNLTTIEAVFEHFDIGIGIDIDIPGLSESLIGVLAMHA